MASANKYPYELKEMFLISFTTERKNEVPHPLELPISAQIKLTEPGFPRVQINMKVNTPPDTAISFNFEIVGLFDYVGENKEYEKELNKEFVLEKALHMLWVYGAQMVKIITGQMGMEPIQLKTPPFFPALQEQPK